MRKLSSHPANSKIIEYAVSPQSTQPYLCQHYIEEQYIPNYKPHTQYTNSTHNSHISQQGTNFLQVQPPKLQTLQQFNIKIKSFDLQLFYFTYHTLPSKTTNINETPHQATAFLQIQPSNPETSSTTIFYNNKATNFLQNPTPKTPRKK